MIAAAEEVGMAAPQILQVTVAAAQAVAMIGMPEARIILAEATIAVATAPKSTPATMQSTRHSPTSTLGVSAGSAVFAQCPTKLMKSWGNHEATSTLTIIREPSLRSSICPTNWSVANITAPTTVAMSVR